MANKKSKSELAAEAKEIKEILAASKQKPHSFALFHGPDDLIFHAHKTKSKSQMRQLCKADGASQKGAVGMLDGAAGTVIDLIVEDPDSTPANFAKAFRKFLQVRGISKKVRLLAEDGGVLDAGEDEEEGAAAAAPDAAPDIGEDIEVVLAKVLKAFEAMRTPLLRSLNSAPKDYKVKLDTALDLFKKAMKAKNPDAAKKTLVALNKLISATPSPVVIVDSIKAAGSDPEKLGKLDSLVKTCAAQVKSDPAFMDRAMPEMRDMRKALKEAMNKTPPPKNIDALKAMKQAMDDMFYDHVDKPPRSHGPEYHGPGLTRDNLEDRVMNQKNPRTGQPSHGAPAFSASSFLDKGAYVDSQMELRTKALKHIDDTGLKPPAKGSRPVRLPAMDAKLKDVLGNNWQTFVHGVKKKTRNNRPDECVDANWGPDSLCRAIYDLLDDGTLRLVTLYPKPVAPPAPPPAPRPANPRPRRNRRRRGGGGGGQP
ncbi:hypothetical protein AB2B41_19880 [Marimonas sp. MJW-29]|uniref:Uncharacterized protein n=1 Tax=Sulfitobacter sediminis TaxID=3234186 RepID=A0ABV3RSF5_9RHOB